MMKLVIIFLFTCLSLTAQDSTKRNFVFWGEIQTSHLYYLPNSNASILYPNFSNQTYLAAHSSIGKFSAGVRLEAYLPSLVGMPQELAGVGLASKYISYKQKKITLTAGNIYQQFGSGLIFKSQEQRSLGMDNSLDGLSVVFKNNLVSFKALAGKQRLGFKRADGRLLGADANFKWASMPNMRYGLGFLLKSENYDGQLTDIKPVVWTMTGRVGFKNSRFENQVEVALKSNDAASANLYTTKLGSAILWNNQISTDKSVISIQLKRTDNMDFRSKRGSTKNTAIINYIPNITKVQSYRLLTLYPYVSQVLGEVGGQIDWLINTKKESTLHINFAYFDGLATKPTTDTRQFKTLIWSIKAPKLFRELNLEYERPISEYASLKMLSSFLYYNRGILLGGKPEVVKANISLLDVAFQLSKTQRIKFECQHLYTQQDKGSWAMALVDYKFSAHFFAFLSEEFNYGSKSKNANHHYAIGGIGLNKKANNVRLSYGRVREGLFCVGGVCQIIPEYKGINLQVNSRF